MSFPIELNSTLYTESSPRKILLHSGLTVLLGPNGSGKTLLLRALKKSIASATNGKKVRFLSAGRMSPVERFRSDVDGDSEGLKYYEGHYGDKSDRLLRHKAEGIKGDFQTLAVRADILIKVQERLKKLLRRQLIIEWEEGQLKVSFARFNAPPYRSGLEASGVLHLVGILSALYDDEVGALLLDEPEVSLHPQFQAFLLNEMLSVAGDPVHGKKLMVIATHSPEFVRLRRGNDIQSLIFCDDVKIAPIQIPVDSEELKCKKTPRLLERLCHEHKLALFCQRPLLVEGSSDVLICSALSRKLDLHLDAAGSYLLPVFGKGQIAIVAKLMRLIGKSPAALTDVDGIADGLGLTNQFLLGCGQADEFAISHGFPNATNMANQIYSDFCKTVQSQWSEIEAHATKHPYWLSGKDEGESKRRAAFATLFSVADDVSFGPTWSRIKTRLCKFLDLLESCGLFVLRKGSIEAYYQNTDAQTGINKPVAAALEMEYIEKLAKSAVRIHYSDILRSIEFAANTEPICESDSIRDMLHAVVAPAHARLKSRDTESDLNLLARTILGDRAKIFDLAVKGDDLIVSLCSKILDIYGFPIRIPRESDCVSVVERALPRKSHLRQ